MNKELREDLEHLIICNDKTITQDLRDDVKMTLDYIDELQTRIDKAIEYIKENACYITDGKNKEMCVDDINYDECMELLNILRGEDNE